MTLSSIFTRTSASAAPAQVSPEDKVYAAAWGHSEDSWRALTEVERRTLRDTVVYAPYFRTEGK